MVKGKARAAGSFLGGLANNPAVVIIALVLGGLFIFRDRISSAIGGLGEGLVNIEFPEIKFPEFPEIKFPEFPEIKFPEFPDFGSLFENFFKQQNELLSSLAGQTVTTEQGQDVMIPPDTMVDPDTGVVTSETPPIVIDGGATFEENLFATTRAGVFDTLVENLGLSPTQAGNIVRGSKTLADLSAILFRANQGQFDIRPRPQEAETQDLTVSSFLLDEPTQKFQGGGLSFIGGSIFETPITANSSLSFIIDQLGVSASQAASIRAELRGFTQEEALFLAPKVITPFGTVFDAAGGGGGGVNVSNQQFAGLTPQQIALQLTGGNISNF